MNVQVDFINHHNAVIINQPGARRTGHAHVIEQVANPAKIRSVAIRKRREGNTKTVLVKYILTILYLTSEMVVAAPHKFVQ